MKKHPKAAFRFGSAVAAMLALTTLLSLTACFNIPSADTPEDSDTQEAVTLPPVTIPDLTDDRVPTDTAEYAERLDKLSEENSPAPAADFTYEITEEGVTVTGYNGGELILVIHR
jgi:hypothetical protein